MRTRDAQDSSEQLSDELQGVTEERNELAQSVSDLERQVAELIERAEAAEVRAESAEAVPPPVAVPAELDDVALTQRLGEETMRVLATARESAREITSKAEAEAAGRMKVLEEREQSVIAELEARQAQVEAELAELRSTTEAELEALRSSTESETSALRASAEDEVAKLKADTEAELAELRSSTEADVATLRADAEKAATEIRSDADTEAARIRSEAEADSLAAADSARETARQMLNEAQTVRERVLTDLVKKRRAGRQQLDQVKAARDRLARSLAVVRKDLDEGMAELAASVPEARTAMEAVGRRVPDVVDVRHAAELAGELDAARESGAPVVEREHDPDIDALFDRLKSLGGSDQAESDAAEAVSDPDESPVDETIDALDEVVTDSAPDGPRADASTGSSPTDADSVAVVEDGVDEDGADEDEGGDGSDERPPAFLARDLVMTRQGPELRRRLKRTLADDQSAVLDNLRRAGDIISIEDLPSADETLALYRQALDEPVRAAAAAGAEFVGAVPRDKTISDLIDRAARALYEPLRTRVENTVASSEGDKAEVLEPIRAQYRDVRAVDLPELADDTMAEAFALALYQGVKRGTSVVWVADPSAEPGADCFDNTLAGPVDKPAAFPTGHTQPPGVPGCRCLVLPA